VWRVFGGSRAEEGVGRGRAPRQGGGGNWIGGIAKSATRSF
jgi:hypothetical protein